MVDESTTVLIICVFPWYKWGTEKTAISWFKKVMGIQLISEVTGLGEDDLLKLFRREEVI
ncbi:MAG: hypothetical protein EA409_06595 [Saprospirales bacterium]|nr:MAG: hypothetical protein EA409_06595 [Saprospirales bacterium]